MHPDKLINPTHIDFQFKGRKQRVAFNDLLASELVLRVPESKINDLAKLKIEQKGNC